MEIDLISSWCFELRLEQPRTQGISSRGLEGTPLGNTLVSAGHVSPRIWEITIKIS